MVTKVVGLTLTEDAKHQLKDMLVKQDDPSLGLRVFVSPGGCSGFQYGMAFDGEIQDGDIITDYDGIKVVVDEFSVKYLDGSEIDYVDSLMGAGFTVRNPNAVSTCGCGHSFDTEESSGVRQSCH